MIFRNVHPVSPTSFPPPVLAFVGVQLGLILLWGRVDATSSTKRSDDFMNPSRLRGRLLRLRAGGEQLSVVSVVQRHSLRAPHWGYATRRSEEPRRRGYVEVRALPPEHLSTTRGLVPLRQPGQ